ncbi:MAG: hypothetical protein IIY04_05960 [Oscillospiraceae bacterium]|nr:hypothetical protein [Oscillospiraceae bacterium]
MTWNEHYVKLDPEKSADHEDNLHIYVSYDLGGYNVWTGARKKRGYYLTCVPVKREGIMNAWIMGKGLTVLLKEVQRSSQAALDEAVAIAQKEESGLIQRVLVQYNLELAEGGES